MQPFAEKIRILGQLRELMVYFCLQQVSFFPEVIATSKPSEMHAQNRGFRLALWTFDKQFAPWQD
jgi:hypothetical protein